ncbi:(Lyso)-N-acylphosphatidylethanolamine lipase isoform X2 [Aricia agestis]|uniref:(Lyso)-N-acylphosphatidylethanolamine lipase isoform X2 n=1 Tax=Aricia agestis TaxID=91739 RepID=UPI001C20A3BB|nr:(Lyso)-N-acylphosphatidylethanolamine lipase isoform X2 [Aricia agestis]
MTVISSLISYCYTWIHYSLPLIQHISDCVSWTGGWFQWTRQSDMVLRNVEQKILSCVKTAYNRFYVDIGSVVGQSDKLWTISLNENSPKTPLLMLHGMAAGVALWCPNLDALAAARPVYAIDLLGFGRSSRPKFASTPEKVTAQWVESIEEWRRELKLQELVLLGHSLGGYIATAYAIKYPERVRHLILADPWGFAEKPESMPGKFKEVPWYVRGIATMMRPFNPLFAVRAAGPAGRWLVGVTRPDIPRKYRTYVPEADDVIPEYIYQCNSQTPSGESAFHSLMTGFGWARIPMSSRAKELPARLPVTVLRGARSWLNNDTAGQIAAVRPGESYTSDQLINGAGHHVYLDKPETFNKLVNEACERADAATPAAKRDNSTPSQVDSTSKSTDSASLKSAADSASSQAGTAPDSPTSKSDSTTKPDPVAS